MTATLEPTAGARRGVTQAGKAAKPRIQGIGATEPRVSVIVPVWKETANIRACLENLNKSARHTSVEVLIVDGEPQRSTLAAIPRKWRSRVIGVRSPAGRALQMNAGAELARGELLVFHHADTRLKPGALREIEAAMADTDLAGGAFSLELKTGSIFLRTLAWANTWRSHLTRVPFGDQSIFIRRRLFASLGGFSPLPLMEDVDLMRRLRKARLPIVVLPTAVRSSARRFEREGPWRCTLRDAFLMAAFGAGISPQWLARLYAPPG